MSDVVIKVENLSKKYTIGAKASGSLRETMVNKWWDLTGKIKTEINEFWALKDVSFEVKQGEVLGIIGKNGAGKSTLLKILSRITEPTSGRIEILGRVSSLLEVGTGFHPELTGRENIYLNGTLLGMSRNEVMYKFDEIIDFSGVEKFIDTPVKHYSSGMYVRLAFAVAAHLEPEILIIDEVLAVGDAEFQKKCLGKMKDVSEKDGRTVIFVSHNLVAVKALCKKGILLANGNNIGYDLINPIVNQYTKNGSVESENKIRNIFNYEYPSGFDKNPIYFKEVFLEKESFTPSEDIVISIRLHNIIKQGLKNIIISCHLNDINDNLIYHISNAFVDKLIVEHNPNNTYNFIILKNSLKPGKYYINLWLGTNGEEINNITNCLSFEILSGNIYNSAYPVLTGFVQPDFDFLIK